MKVVTDSVLVLGLAKLYREQMKTQESLALLPAARRVASALGISPAADFEEGYYGDSVDLNEYFGIMRALQEVEGNSISEVERMPAYRLLDEVCSSRLYGFRPVPKGILHIGRDSLTEALAQEAAAGHSWHIEGLVQLAGAVAATEDDYSLVGLAARTRDAACIVVTRESMVLYTELGTLGMKLGEYEWAVTQEMQEQAARFVEEFRRILHCDLPAVKPENAACYYSAYEDNSVYGRCVRIGHNPYTTPPMYYYWRIDGTHGGNDQVSEFWSNEIWTTGRNVARHIADADPNAHESRI